MIDINQFKDKIKKLFLNEQPVLMKNNNVYYVLENYKIVKQNEFYELYHHNIFKDKTYKSKTAISWCIAHYEQRWELARDLILTDHRLAAREFDVDIHSLRMNQGDKTYRALHRDLYYENVDRSKMLKRKLNKLTNLAKYNKIKDLKNESQRISA